nr:heat shock factor protein 5 isoform X2 [Monopterus albus]
MDIGESSLPASINPNNFPAKLWRLVNNPDSKAIHWDSQGEVIIIDKQLFESQILSPYGTSASDNPDVFKTTNFSSFVRQLNLYGFRKAETSSKDISFCSRDSGTSHHFYNPNFKRNHPELVASLRRLTVSTKAKLQAGLKVNGRTPNCCHRFYVDVDGRNKNIKRGSSSLLIPQHQDSPHPYYTNKAQATTVHSGTPAPLWYPIRGPVAAASPSAFTADKGIRELSHHCTGIASRSNDVPIRQDPLASGTHAHPNVTSFNPHNAQYQSGYYSPVCHYYPSNTVVPHMAVNGLQIGMFSPPLYQASYMFYHGDHNQNLQKKENQEQKKCDVSLDTVFRIADEVMQTPSSNYRVTAVTPEKPGPAVMLSSNSSITTANQLFGGSITMSVSDSVDRATCRQQEESVILVPEQMPEDAIIQVTNDEAKDTEVVSVEVGNTHMDPSQAQNSGYARELHQVCRSQHVNFMDM